MVGNRGQKRKRGDMTEPSDPPPSPFVPACSALFRTYAGPASRRVNRGPAQPAVNLAVVAAHRLVARDFAGAAATMPALLRRMRRRGRSPWFFTREVSVAGAEILRRTGKMTDLETFLTLIARDTTSSHISGMEEPQGYASHTRDGALLELALELIAVGRTHDALSALRAEVALEPFASSALVHGFIGMLSLALCADEEDDQISLLSTATVALGTAASLDPAAHCFVHYAAAAAVAAGDTSRAIKLQRDFLATNASDPLALAGLLHSLGRFHALDSKSERVELARRLLRIDPVSCEALKTMQEALAWSWDASPRVELAEVADMIAIKIECGAGDDSTWSALHELLSKASDTDISRFMFDSGRATWWSSHVFRRARALQDVAKSTALATVKMAVAQLIYGDCEYVQNVSAIVNKVPEQNDDEDFPNACYSKN